MGLFDSFFGSTQEQESSFTREPWGPAQDPLSDIAGRVEKYLRSRPFEFFPGQTYAPQTASELGAIESLQGAAGMWPGQVMPAWEGMLGAADVANNPYVTGMAEAIQSRVNRNLSENILPQIGVGQVGQGGFGTSGDVAAGIASRGTQEVLSEQLANLYGGAYGMGLQAQQGALGMAPGMFAQPAAFLGQAGALERQEGQRAIDEAMQRHQFQQMEPWQRMQMGAGLVGPIGQLGSEGTSMASSTSTPSPFQAIGGLIGAGSSLAGGFAPMMNFGGGAGAGMGFPGIGQMTFGGSNPLYQQGTWGGARY